MRPYTLGSHPVGTEAPPDQRLPLIRNTEKNGLARAGPFFHAARKRRQEHNRRLHSGACVFELPPHHGGIAVESFFGTRE